MSSGLRRPASATRPQPIGLCHQASSFGLRRRKLFLSASPVSLSLPTSTVGSSSLGLRRQAFACWPYPSTSASRPPPSGLRHWVLANGPPLHDLRLPTSLIGLGLPTSAVGPPPAGLPCRPRLPYLRRRVLTDGPPLHCLLLQASPVGLSFPTSTVGSSSSSPR